MTNSDSKITWRYILNLARNEAHKISWDNGFYDWGLQNERLRHEINLLVERANLFWRNRITESQFVTALHIYFGVVYDETEKEWYRLCDSLRNTLSPDTPLPLDCVKLTSRELDFITERFAEWLFREREDVYDAPVFDNNIGEQDYSHIKIGVIDKSYLIQWGRKHRGRTIGEIMEIDPQWLIWANENTERLPLEDDLKQEILNTIGQNVH